MEWLGGKRDAKECEEEREKKLQLNNLKSRTNDDNNQHTYLFFCSILCIPFLSIFRLFFFSSVCWLFVRINKYQLNAGIGARANFFRSCSAQWNGIRSTLGATSDTKITKYLRHSCGHFVCRLFFRRSQQRPTEIVRVFVRYSCRCLARMTFIRQLCKRMLFSWHQNGFITLQWFQGKIKWTATFHIKFFAIFFKIFLNLSIPLSLRNSIRSDRMRMKNCLR